MRFYLDEGPRCVSGQAARGNEEIGGMTGYFCESGVPPKMGVAEILAERERIPICKREAVLGTELQ